MIIPKNIYHFSVDDVFDALIEVSDWKISLFEHPFFKFLKEINKEFGVKVGLHLFFQKSINGKMRTLKEIANIRDEIEKNPWLFFGPHALEYETPPYMQSKSQQIETFEKIYKEINRFAGQRSYTKYVRLQYYSESFELADYFKEKGVIALFSTDREVGSHRMPKSIGKKLLEKGAAKYKGMNFIKTQFRVEFFRDEGLNNRQIIEKFKKAFEKYNFLIFYTHEVDMNNENGRRMTIMMLNAAKNLNLPSIHIP